MKLSNKTTTLAVSATALIGAASAAYAGFLWWGKPPPAPAHAPALAPTPVSGTAPASGASPSYHDGSFTGPAVYQYYGYVQVKVNIHKGKISSVKILRYPKDYNTSIYINTHALPMLKSELIQAQNLKISGISGATLTSEAFYMSAKAALKKATG